MKPDDAPPRLTDAELVQLFGLTELAEDDVVAQDLYTRGLAEALADPQGFRERLEAALVNQPDETPRAAPESLTPAQHLKRLTERAALRRRLFNRPDQPQLLTPTSLAELAAHVRDAARDGYTLRPVGSYRSLADVNEPDAGGKLLALSHLNAVDVDPARRLGWVQPGVNVGRLTTALQARTPPLMMLNLGSGDFQTVIGAVSTGTHGTGYKLGDLASTVVQVELLTVDADGALRHLVCVRDGAEITVGPKHQAHQQITVDGVPVPRVVLVDGDTFDAATISLGLLGVVVGMVVELTEQVWLQESRHTASLRSALARLFSAEPTNVRHMEVLVDPFQRLQLGVPDNRTPNDTQMAPDVGQQPDVDDHGELDLDRIAALVTRRADLGASASAHGHRNVSMALAAGPLGRTVAGDRARAFSRHPRRIPNSLRQTITCTEVKRFVRKAPWVLKLGMEVEGTGMEILVPWDRAEAAVIEVMRVIRRRWKALVAIASVPNGDVVQGWRDHAVPTGAVSLRPVARSPSLLSMAYAPPHERDGAPYLAIELLCLRDPDTPHGDAHHEAYVTGYKALYDEVERTLCAAFDGVNGFGGRQHWGQEFTATADDAHARWGDAWTRFLAVREALDPRGVFRSAAAVRMGL